MELRRAGYSFEEIAERLGYADPSGPHKVYWRKINANLVTNTEEARQHDLDRIEAMFQAVWPAARRGDARAIDTAMKLMDRRAKLLGLDAPTKIEVKETQQDVEAMLSSVEGMLMMAEVEQFMSSATNTD